MSLRNSVYTPQSSVEQTQLTCLHFFSLPTIKHKEGILSELSLCVCVLKWGASLAADRRSARRLVSASGKLSPWVDDFLDSISTHVLWSCKRNREDPYRVNIFHKEDWRSLTRKYIPDGLLVQNWKASVFRLSEVVFTLQYIGYQSSQEQNLCPCYLTFVNPPATTWKFLIHQKKDTNQNRDEQWVYKRILNWSCCYFQFAELMISIIRC